MFTALRVPAPTNTSACLAKLEQAQKVIRLGGGRWAVTPLGEQSVSKEAITWSPAEFASDYAATFAGSQHHTIPPELAPAPIVRPVGTFLDSFAFDRNVFGISRYPRDRADDPMSRTFETARSVLGEFGLTLHLAADRAVTDELWSNIAALMWACRYGVVIIEDCVGEGVNRNALIELGAMLMTGRRCVLLKDTTVARVPTDLIGHIRRDVDLRDQSSVDGALRDWCAKDLGLAATPAYT
jgi:hypothetical protein